MATVTIKGTFKNTENKGVDMEVYRPNPDGYVFRNFYVSDFTKVFNDLKSGKLYFVDLNGHAIGGSLEISISGDVQQTVSKTFTDTFQPGLKFKVK